MGLRVAFFGTPAFAVPTLTALIESVHQVVGVVTQPDRPRGRGQHVSDAPVKATAIVHGLPVLQPARLAADEFASVFAALDAELGVVAAYGKLLPEWLLRAPRLGMINVHASLLPRWRGAAPVHRAVLSGDAETGVTIMRVVKALDAGPMLARVTRPIGPDESSDRIEHDLAVMGARLLVRVTDALASGPVPEEPQDDARATYAPRLTKEEGRLDFTQPAIALHNRIRGLRPWPGAFTFVRGVRLAVLEASPSRDAGPAGAPGTCLAVGDEGLTVACGAGTAILLRLLQPEGRKPMTARAFEAGHRPLVGVQLG